jgi:drug/metabolite transporter (DMT)-like permease
MSADKTTTGGREAGQRSGAFDVRIVIGVLLGIYGIVLVVTGLVDTSEAELAKSDDMNINLWAGAGMVVAALVFIVWARLRPLLIPVDYGRDDSESGPPAH